MGRDPIPSAWAFPTPAGAGEGVSGISLGFPRLSRRGGRWSRVTHPFATSCPPEGGFIVRLACVRHAASVHPEPGSNSPFKRRESLPAEVRSWFRPSPAPVLRVRARAGFRSQEFVCLAFLSSLFSIRFSRFCSILSDPAALVCFKRVRKYFTVSFLSCQELFSNSLKPFGDCLSLWCFQERSVPRFPQTRVLYITRKVYVRQWVILQNLKLFCSDWQNPR